MNTVRIAIVGSRTRSREADRQIIHRVIDELADEFGLNLLTIVSGGCSGPDTFAEIYARHRGIAVDIMRPKIGRRATKWQVTEAMYARNKIVAESSKRVYALTARDRKGGTENTIKYAQAAGVPVILK